jgi:hypothetical protein
VRYAPACRDFVGAFACFIVAGAISGAPRSACAPVVNPADQQKPESHRAKPRCYALPGRDFLKARATRPNSMSRVRKTY